MKSDLFKILEVSVVVAFAAFGVYVNAQKVPSLERSIQSHEVRISVSEANYSNILKSLERIERRLK